MNNIIDPFTNIPLLMSPENDPNSAPAYLPNVKEINIGDGGSNVFRADRTGIWLGAAKFNDAPFSVSMAGVIKATGLVFNWGDITGTGKPDDNATAGATWNSNISGQPSDSSITNPDYIKSTKITSTDIESPTITAGTITGGTITGATITAKLDTTSIASLDSGGLKIYGQYATWYNTASTPVEKGQIYANNDQFMISTFRGGVNKPEFFINGTSGLILNSGYGDSKGLDLRCSNSTKMKIIDTGVSLDSPMTCNTNNISGVGKITATTVSVGGSANLTVSGIKLNIDKAIETSEVSADYLTEISTLRMSATSSPLTDNGSIYFNGAHFYGRIAGAWKQLDN